MGDNKNFFLFAVLSLAFFMGYEYFVLGPKMQKAREAQEAQIAEQAKPATEQAAGSKITPPEERTSRMSMDIKPSCVHTNIVNESHPR